MSLIECPSCRKSISSDAAQCLGCGHPIAGKKTEATTGMSAIIVMIGVGLSVFLSYKLWERMNNTVLILTISAIPTVLAFVVASMRKK